MKEDGANVIKVTVECEKTSSSLVRPDLDLVVIATRYKERLRLVKVDTSDRTVVFFESVN